MAAKINIAAVIPDSTAASLIQRIPRASNARQFFAWLFVILSGIASGIRRGRFRFSADESTGTYATITVTAVQASATAGDQLIIQLPGLNVVALTAVATTPVPGDRTYAIITSNTAEATSLRSAINNDPFLSKYINATGTSTLVLTSRIAGAWGNGIRITKKVTTAGAFTGTGVMTGGVEPGALNTTGVTFTIAAALSNNDTLTIGSVVLTGKTSGASGESQFVDGVSVAADTTALTACINNHSKLKGLYTATGVTGTGVITILCWLEGRELYSTTIVKSAAQGSLSAATWVPPTTDVWASNTIDYVPANAA